MEQAVMHASNAQTHRVQWEHWPIFIALKQSFYSNLFKLRLTISSRIKIFLQISLNLINNNSHTPQFYMLQKNHKQDISWGHMILAQRYTTVFISQYLNDLLRRRVEASTYVCQRFITRTSHHASSIVSDLVMTMP